MPKKPTFHITRSFNEGAILRDQEATPYTPLLVTAGTETHKLALHQDKGAWVVSDPISGGKLLDVIAHYKGCPVSSAGFTVRQIRPSAQDALDQLIQRVGSEKFNKVLAQGRLLVADKGSNAPQGGSHE